MTPPESRIALLDNGVSPRQKARAGSHNATVAEVHESITAVRGEIVQVVEHYMRQVPGLFGRMLDDLMAKGILMPGPNYEAARVAKVSPEVPENTAQYDGPTDTIPPVTDGVTLGKDMGEA